MEAAAERVDIEQESKYKLCANILRGYSPTKTSMGVRMMLENINALKEGKEGLSLSEEDLGLLDGFIREYITPKENEGWDHLELRIGDEVIFQPEDLQ